jgi:hypothetical protein
MPAVREPKTMSPRDFQGRLRKALTKLSVALTLAEDGALHTAADRAMEASNELRTLALIKGSALAAIGKRRA